MTSRAQNSRKTAPGRPFQKGQSGNPGGRPRDELRIRELARQYTREALDTLVRALKDNSARVRVAAAEAILDRGWGRPTQQVELGGSDDLASALDRAWERVRARNEKNCS